MDVIHVNVWAEKVDEEVKKLRSISILWIDSEEHVDHDVDGVVPKAGILINVDVLDSWILVNLRDGVVSYSTSVVLLDIRNVTIVMAWMAVVI